MAVRAAAECLICGSNRLKSRRAAVAPFVAHRIWGRDSFGVKLVSCAECRFAFFNPRLEEAEEQRLYSDYRSDAYQQMRYSFEPWYTEGFHENLFSDATMQARQESLRRILAPYVAKLPVRTILDFGGGRGELISDLVTGSDRYVYDLSDAEALPGICKLKSLSECRSHSYDLIVCSNVLEHVAFPREVLRQIVEVASPGTQIFVEVPYESPFAYRENAKRLAQAVIMFLRRPRLALSLVRLGMLYVMHEHVNFFTSVALARLVSAVGLDVQASGFYGENSLANAKMLWSLARRNEA